MSRYSIGTIAVVLAIGFSSFAVNKKATIFYKVTGKVTTTSPQRYKVTNQQFSSISCQSGSNTCKLSADQTLMPSHETSDGDYYYFEVSAPGISPTAGAFQAP